MHKHTHVTTFMWWSEGNCWELVLACYLVASGDGPKDIRAACKHVYLLGHFTVTSLVCEILLTVTVNLMGFLDRTSSLAHLGIIRVTYSYMSDIVWHLY